MEQITTPRLYDNLLTTLETWKSLYRNTYQAKQHGHKSFLSNFLSLLQFLETSIPSLQNWCAEYMADSKWDDQLRGWLTYGVCARDSNIPVQFEMYWKLFFRRDDDEPDIAVLNGKEFDISFRHYQRLLQEKTRDNLFSSCNDLDILALHEDKPCQGGFVCFLCETQEDQWIQKVQERYQSMNNIFINETCGKDFIEEWMSSVKKMTEEERSRIQYCWPPVLSYSTQERYSWNSKPLTSFLPIYLSHLQTSRHQLYYTYDKRPKVEFELVKDVDCTFQQYSPPSPSSGANQWNDLFLSLSHFVTYATYMIFLDKRRCNEVISIYSTLPDD